MHKLVTTVILLLVATDTAMSQSRFGVRVTTHHAPPGALIVETFDGHPCQRIYSVEDGRHYHLAAYLHVVTEINGVRIGTAQECIKAVFASPPRMKFRIYNRHSGSHRQYEVALIGASRGELDLGRSLDWKPGVPHRKYDHVVAAPAEGNWRPAPGYVWVGGSGVRPVRWKRGTKHPDYHIMATREGSWTPMPGHTWLSKAHSDFRVRWSPGREHPEHSIVAQAEHGVWQPKSGYGWLTDAPDDFRVRRRRTSSSSSWNSDSYSRQNTGSENFGLTEQFYRQVDRDLFNLNYSRNFNHAPVTTGPLY